MARRPFSLTPCFSGVYKGRGTSEPFQRFYQAAETVKTIQICQFLILLLIDSVNRLVSSKFRTRVSLTINLSLGRLPDGSDGYGRLYGRVKSQNPSVKCGYGRVDGS